MEDSFYRYNIQKVKLQWHLLLLPPVGSQSKNELHHRIPRKILVYRGGAIKAATEILLFECCDDEKYLPLTIEG